MLTKSEILHILIERINKCGEREEYLFITCQREAVGRL